ncbi:deoxyribodipyrimidine photo-lyase (plasmid) [Deinococcus radiomollis]|uniref:cryptochrome/photolyase family protein n=1 Tax=Deinococcus radiomollis TaxID=468916 RepID=UPI0038919742
MGSSSASSPAAHSGPASLLWFRKGLRLHDNPALHAALEGAVALYPVFVLDPTLLGPARVGVNRTAFLLESLRALDAGLKERGSRLIVLRGEPLAELERVMMQWRIGRLVFEADTEPYARVRDAGAAELARRLGAELKTPGGHTLYDPGVLAEAAGGTLPLSYGSFLKLVAKVGEPPAPLPTPERLPPVGDLGEAERSGIPTLVELGHQEKAAGLAFVTPGEQGALATLSAWTSVPARVAAFEKPATDPSAYAPAATTRLSAHMKFGSLSARTFYHALREAERAAGAYSQPPTSLAGQLLWREMFTTIGAVTPNYDRMVGNPVCRQIDWDDTPALLAAWTEGHTGYPWIDAAMRQLNTEGWMHHLARHSVACFLTRGDLWQSWEAGQGVFDRLLIDADWSLNAANWMWLSASAFFTAIDRIYSPVAFAKKYAGARSYVRHYLPELAGVPDAFLLEPWTMTAAQQRQAGCVLGRDYPLPIVDHAPARERNLSRMRAAYARGRKGESPASG